MEVNLVFIDKNGTQQSFPLPSAVTFIGRRHDCDLTIPLSVVSRRHCEIYSEFGKLMVRDLKSRNGTVVNDESIEETQIKAGDILKIGPIRFIVQIDGVPASFDQYLPSSSEQAAQSKPPAGSRDETQEADFNQIIAGLETGNGGQSETMDINDVFSNDCLEDDDFDIDSDMA